MKKIMIVGAGDFQLPLVQKAAEKYEVVLVAPSIDACFEPYVSQKYYCDVRDLEVILEAAKKEQIDGIVTDQTDIPVRTVAYVAEQLGLKGIGYEVAKVFTDKNLMRETLVNSGIDAIPYVTTDSLEEAEAFFRSLRADVVVKPLDTQGSRGVIKVKYGENIADAFEVAKGFSGNGKAVVEQYIYGEELVIEGIVQDGD